MLLTLGSPIRYEIKQKIEERRLIHSIQMSNSQLGLSSSTNCSYSQASCLDFIHTLIKMTSSTRVLSKILKPELLQLAKNLDKRLEAQEKAIMVLFYLFVTAISAEFIF